MWWTQPCSATWSRVCDRQRASRRRRRRARRTTPAAARRASSALRAAVVVALVPVEVPDVVAPARSPAARTPRRSRSARRRCGTPLLGAGDDLERVEQPEVHRGAEISECAIHGSPSRIGVLVGAERLGSRWSTKSVQRGQRLAPRDGEAARPVAADERDPVAVATPTGRGPRGPRRRCRPRSATTARSTPRVVAPLGGGSRLSWSKFHEPPAGSPSSSGARRARRRASR